MRALQKIKFNYLLISTLLIGVGGNEAKAQLTGFHSMYFENEYLNNPAMAGLQKGLNIDLGYQQQWTNVPGGPKLQNATADYNSGNNVGLGINVNANQAGLISVTRAMATYAYHLATNGNGSKLNFGLSLGINNTYIDYSRIVGDASDVQAANFNSQQLYIDGDFGISYTTNKLTVQGAIPNLKSMFFPKDGDNLEVDRSTFFAAASYKFWNGQNNDITVQPKVAVRGINGFDNIIDAGVNVDIRNYNFNVSSIYHNNKAITFGVGFKLPATDLLFAYTSNTGPLSAYINNTFEFGVKLKVFR